ncbi:uncharacterized protein DUF4912 [Orenia metallireducens]|nr:DUF4912 domain-containing protein [Orenia metallireducens]PRX34905.1 uncharacterized protein DUF4912 [Orenia metallireducens]
MSEIRELYFDRLEGMNYLLEGSVSTSQLTQQKRANLSAKSINSHYTIPDNYNSNKLFLEAKNPITVYAYWEYTFDKINKAAFSAGYEDIRKVNLLLRIYDLTEGNNLEDYSNLEVSFADDSCYINNLKQGHKYLAKLGVVDRSDKFHVMIESNQIIL